MVNSNNESNWLVSYGLLIFSCIFSLSLFFIYGLAYDSFNPLKWTFTDSFIFWSLFFTFPTCFILNYLIEKSNLDVVGFIGSFFDIFEYKNSNKKALDCILSHYTNVATVGLLLMSIIYISKPYIPEVIGFLSGFGLAILYCLVFFIYSLFLARLAVGLINGNKFIYFISCIGVLFLDMQVIELLIKSVPNAT
ncbi:hypothetical protein [Motilimonas eburnea]|uniref:hypothetical protein n=1 Tax=Motilimonas eburnea TaxID=1737488 RepID=UPI001E5A4078|nr:hypothetical protein [Motilimonas eburnea]MCE2573078.1 hypothetical protein [Motilimonas eburnea]